MLRRGRSGDRDKASASKADLAGFGFNPIQGDRVRLRRLRAGDASAFVVGLDEDILRQQGWGDSHVARVAVLYARLTKATEPHTLVIEDRTTEAVVGFIAISRTTSPPKLGWWINAGHRRKGYATEAVGLVLGGMHDHGAEVVGFSAALDDVANITIAGRVDAVEVAREDVKRPNGDSVPSIRYEHRGTLAATD